MLGKFTVKIRKNRPYKFDRHNPWQDQKNDPIEQHIVERRNGVYTWYALIGFRGKDISPSYTKFPRYRSRNVVAYDGP